MLSPIFCHGYFATSDAGLLLRTLRPSVPVLSYVRWTAGVLLAPVAVPWFFCEVISLMALSETPVSTLCAPSHFFLRLCVLVWRDGCHVAGIQFWQHPTVSSYSLLLRRFEVHWKPGVHSPACQSLVV